MLLDAEIADRLHAGNPLAALRARLEAMRGGPFTGAAEALERAAALEAQSVDALDPEDPAQALVRRALRRLTLEVAHLYRAAQADDVAGAAAAAERSLHAIARLAGLRGVEGSTDDVSRAPHPRLYLEAAQRFLGASAHLPGVVIGLRRASGAGSAVVAAVLESAGRPTRCCALAMAEASGAGGLARHAGDLRDAIESGGWVVLVDDAGDLGARDFCRAAAALNALGAGDEQIVMMPSARAETGDLDASERSAWSRRRKVTVAVSLLGMAQA